MAPPQAPGIPSIPLFTGPLALGSLLSCGLYGMLIVQISVYATHFPKDSLWMKSSVWTVFFLETIYTLFTVFLTWKSFGTDWGDVETLYTFSWPWYPLPLLNALVASLVQFFFAWRICRLSQRLWIPIPIVVLSLLQLSATTHYNSVLIQHPEGSTLTLMSLRASIDLWLVGSAVCDVLISTSMIFILVRAGSQTFFSQSNSYLNRLVKLTIETGFVTTIGAILELILWHTMPDNNFHFIVFFILGRLYSNVLLSSLNARAIFSSQYMGYPTAIHRSPRSPFWSDLAWGSRPRHPDNLTGSISVHTTLTQKGTNGCHPLAVVPQNNRTAVTADKAIFELA